MGTTLGEVRAALGLVGTLFGLRRRRILVLERQRQLESVLREAVMNLQGIRRVWNEEHNRFNWRAWLHTELLHTRTWREHRASLTTRLDGGPVVANELAADLDVLYSEFDDAARGSHAYSSDWEPRLVDVAMRLREAAAAYPRGILDRSATVGRPHFSLPEIDERIRTPSSPVEMQQRALAKLTSYDLVGSGLDESTTTRGAGTDTDTL